MALTDAQRRALFAKRVSEKSKFIGTPKEEKFFNYVDWKPSESHQQWSSKNKRSKTMNQIMKEKNIQF